MTFERHPYYGNLMLECSFVMQHVPHRCTKWSKSRVTSSNGDLKRIKMFLLVDAEIDFLFAMPFPYPFWLAGWMREHDFANL